MHNGKFAVYPDNNVTGELSAMPAAVVVYVEGKGKGMSGGPGAIKEEGRLLGN